MNIFLKILPVFLYLIMTLLLFAWRLTTTSFEIRHIIGLVIALLSFSLWIVARFQLGKSFSIKPKATSLVTTGIYSKIRHPVYVFSLTAIFSLYIFYNELHLLGLFLFALISQIYRMRKEDQVLLKKFGKEYERYKSKTWF